MEHFSGCEKLESIIIPDSVTSIGDNSFQYCKSLRSIRIPNNVTTIGMGAFYGCRSLRRIHIPKNVLFIGTYAFKGCDYLTIYIHEYSHVSKWEKKWNPDRLPIYLV